MNAERAAGFRAARDFRGNRQICNRERGIFRACL
jgi:hypothetical protein